MKGTMYVHIGIIILDTINTNILWYHFLLIPTTTQFQKYFTKYYNQNNYHVNINFESFFFSLNFYFIRTGDKEKIIKKICFALFNMRNRKKNGNTFCWNRTWVTIKLFWLKQKKKKTPVCVPYTFV